MSEQAKKWMHWCEACKVWVAHVCAHGVSENEALLRRAEQAERALSIADDTIAAFRADEITLRATLARVREQLILTEQMRAQADERVLIVKAGRDGLREDNERLKDDKLGLEGAYSQCTHANSDLREENHGLRAALEGFLKKNTRLQPLEAFGDPKEWIVVSREAFEQARATLGYLSLWPQPEKKTPQQVIREAGEDA